MLRACQVRRWQIVGAPLPNLSPLRDAVALVVAVGALLSPVDSTGASIFLDTGNLTDVLRQVSIIGIIAIGMTLDDEVGCETPPVWKEGQWARDYGR